MSTVPVIRPPAAVTESARQRMLRKLIPAWVVSGAVHVTIAAGLVLGGALSGNPAPPPPSDAQLTVVTDDKPQEEKTPDLTNPAEGLDPSLIAVAPNDNVQDVNVDAAVKPNEPPGADTAAVVPTDVLAGAGQGGADAGVMGDLGSVLAGAGAGGSTGTPGTAARGRSGATKSRLLAAGGGNDRTEAAVARGIVWLARQQRANGSWQYDNSNQHRSDFTAATGMALLPFLAAGQTHKGPLEKKAAIDYTKHVAAGVEFLVNSQRPDGSFASARTMYSHAVATVALCESLGLTNDRALQVPCQKAIGYIQTGQGPDGSWGYRHKDAGDTSIVGWQVQALHSAKLCKDLQVSPAVLAKAMKFLDFVAAGPNKSEYGYKTALRNRPPLTAVGLLCRYYEGGWRPENPGMAAGVKALLEQFPPDPKRMNMYYYYYATQVLHFYEGTEWHKDWNPKMRDLLLDRQVPATAGADAGSWPTDGEPDGASIGSECGRLGMTSLSLLTLQVYYRQLPLYKRGNGGEQFLK